MRRVLSCLYARKWRRCPVPYAREAMRASEDSYRLYNCARCAKQVRICRQCDRGNRYCAEGCAQQSRRESRRRAARRYQQSQRGACKHAARQRAWRSRHAQKVTHHGCLASAFAFIVSFIATTRQEDLMSMHRSGCSCAPRDYARIQASVSMNSQCSYHAAVSVASRCRSSRASVRCERFEGSAQR